MLTLLIHLGYLAYDEATETVHIPNEELRREFARSIRDVKRDETIWRVRESDQLIYDTVHGNAKDHYLKFEELPAGDGYADLVYLPKKDSMLPALVIEMEWNMSAKGAIAQIKEKNYPEAIKGYGGEILLVGINYDRNAPAGKRKHECVIEDIKEI